MQPSHFSPNEARVIKILGRRKMTIAQLTEKFYARGIKPISAENYIASVVRRINDKCEYYELKWKLEGEGLGRHGRKVWRTKKK